MNSEMPELKPGVIYWKLAIWKLCYGSFKTAGTFYVGATASVRFVDLHPDQKFLVLISMAMAVTTFIDGFLDQTIGRLIAGKPPIKLPSNGGSGDTTHIIKQP